MAALPDVELLHRVGADLTLQAGQLRRRSAQLSHTAEATVWRSSAARLCRLRVAELAADCQRLAGQLDAAATAVLQHAAAVQRRSEEAVALAREVLTLGLAG